MLPGAAHHGNAGSELRSQIVASQATGENMAFDTILFEIDGAIARVTLNRPDKLNSFNVQMHTEIKQALAQLSASDARVMVLTGAGRGLIGFNSRAVRSATCFECRPTFSVRRC